MRLAWLLTQQKGRWETTLGVLYDGEIADWIGDCVDDMRHDVSTAGPQSPGVAPVTAATSQAPAEPPTAPSPK